MSAATLVHTSSREADAALAVARIAAAARVRAARLAVEAEWAAEDAANARYREQGQSYADGFCWCLICGRATDHFGEHTEQQIAAWRDGRRSS